VKYLIPSLLGVGIVLSVGFTHWVPGMGLDQNQHGTRIADLSWAEIRAIEEEAERIQEWGRGVLRFHNSLEEVKDQLRTGQLSLADAADLLHEAALRDNPGFLRSLDSGFADSPRREQFALILLGHLRHELQGGAAPLRKVRVVEELSCDLMAWPDVSAATLAALYEAEASAPAHDGPSVTGDEAK
jgi:hypothetical protein